jgi:hypothetical protein
MKPIFQCGDNTALVAYMYDESEPAERTAIAAHIAVCAACAAELASLQSARQQLAAWMPPTEDLAFVMGRPQASTLARASAHAEYREPLEAPAALLEGERHASRGRRFGRRVGGWWHQPLPAWAQAAAAVAIFAAGMALGLAGGTMRAARPVAVESAAAPAPAGATASVDDLAALEQRLHTEIAQIRASAASTGAGAPQLSEAQLLARVRSLIDESERRQQRELALRTAQVMRDVDSQRRVDLAQIQRSFGQIEGLTGAEAREQREMLNHLIRVSQQR